MQTAKRGCVEPSLATRTRRSGRAPCSWEHLSEDRRRGIGQEIIGVTSLEALPRFVCTVRVVAVLVDGRAKWRTEAPCG